MPESMIPTALRAMGVAHARDLDVRPILARGEEPFGAIMNAADALAGDEALHLIAPFEPRPLYSVMRGRGFALHTSRDDQVFHVWFYRAPS